MEFCISVFVEKFNAVNLTSKPTTIQMMGGEGINSNDVGKLYWNEGIYLKFIPSIQYLLRLLPKEYLHSNLVCISIGNSMGVPCNFGTHYEAESQAILAQTSLNNLLATLLNNQRIWAVFFERDCDQIDHIFDLSVTQLLEYSSNVWDYSSTLSRGFGAYSRTF